MFSVPVVAFEQSKQLRDGLALDSADYPHQLVVSLFVIQDRSWPFC